nr:MAG TPA: hypothetical protein [Caudoviricetes sp.]
MLYHILFYPYPWHFLKTPYLHALLKFFKYSFLSHLNFFSCFLF